MLVWSILGFFLPVLVLTLPVVFVTWKRGNWWILDFFAICLPGPLWVLLVDEWGRGKSLSNLVELPVLAVLVAAAALGRGLAGRRYSRLGASVLFLVSTLLLTLVGVFFVPGFPE